MPRRIGFDKRRILRDRIVEARQQHDARMAQKRRDPDVSSGVYSFDTKMRMRNYGIRKTKLSDPFAPDRRNIRYNFHFPFHYAAPKPPYQHEGILGPTGPGPFGRIDPDLTIGAIKQATFDSYPYHLS